MKKIILLISVCVLFFAGCNIFPFGADGQDGAVLFTILTDEAADVSITDVRIRLNPEKRDIDSIDETFSITAGSSSSEIQILEVVPGTWHVEVEFIVSSGTGEIEPISGKSIIVSKMVMNQIELNVIINIGPPSYITAEFTDKSGGEFPEIYSTNFFQTTYRNTLYPTGTFDNGYIFTADHNGGLWQDGQFKTPVVDESFLLFSDLVSHPNFNLLLLEKQILLYRNLAYSLGTGGEFGIYLQSPNYDVVSEFFTPVISDFFVIGMSLGDIIKEDNWSCSWTLGPLVVTDFHATLVLIVDFANIVVVEKMDLPFSGAFSTTINTNALIPGQNYTVIIAAIYSTDTSGDISVWYPNSLLGERIDIVNADSIVRVVGSSIKGPVDNLAVYSIEKPCILP